MAMNITVTVWDSEENEPLSYASVQQKGTSNDATTNDNGVATLTVPDDATIVVSYIGYEKMEKSASASMRFDMKSSTTNLQDVTVVACSTANGAKTVACEKCTDSDRCSTDSCSGTCVVTECYEPCYKLKNGKCELQKADGGIYLFTNKQCTLTCLSISGYAPDPKDQWKCTQDCTASITDKNVKHAKYRGSQNPNNVKCEITECKGKYHVSDDKQSCVPDQGDCTSEQLAAIHASEGYLITRENKCIPKKCLEPEYKKEGNGDNATCASQTGKPCKAKNAASATYEMQNGKLVCVIKDCNNGYKVSDNKCTRDCLAEAQKTDPLAKKAEYDDKNVCQITDCNSKDGKKYVVVDNKCVEKERDCTDAELKAMNIPGATAGTWSSKKGACTPTACSEPQYEPKPKGGKCVSVDDSNCDTKPENSKKSHQKYNEATGTVQCIVDECQAGYRPADDGLSCILEKALSEEDAKKRMEELKDNAQKMKEREQSTENKLLGAAGIGAVGIGGMNIASALSEKSADADAEEDMKAYLATFRCDYGQGRNITGGETNIELPGGNDLLTYTTEYKQLAQNLKIDKEALGMMPGIESEVVFDKAETGLYDNVGIGTQPGAFTSLSRALLDENSADAKAWAAQKDATASKLKTGLVVAGVGAVGSLAGNLAINHGKGDKSDKILKEYESKKIDIKPNKIPCSQISGTTGSGYSPDCQCAGTNVYFSENDGCVQCDTNAHMVVSADRTACECDSANGYLPVENDPTRCEKPQAPQPDNNTCKNITGYYDPQTCQCYPGTTPFSNINRETVCGCASTSTQRWNALSKTCEKCDKSGDLHPTKYCECADGATLNGNKCTKTETPTIPEDNSVVFNVDASGTFEPGKDQFESGVCNDIITKMVNNNDYKQQFNVWKSGSDKNVNIAITGHTDFQGFKANTGPNKQALDKKSNEELSKKRAEHMKECIESNKAKLFGDTSVQAQYTPAPTGNGWNDCDAGNGAGVYPTNGRNRDQVQCRKVEVIITFGTPTTGATNIIRSAASILKI